MEFTLPAVYRTSDPIDNLLVRVTLRKVSGPSNATQGERAAAPNLPALRGGIDAAPGLPPLGGANAAAPAPLGGDAAAGAEEEIVAYFPWQRKVFGPRELLKYAAAVDERRSGRATGLHTSPVEAEYIAEIEGLMTAGVPLFQTSSSVMLYTHSDRDAYVPPAELLRNYMDPTGNVFSADEGSGPRAPASSAATAAAAAAAAARGPSSDLAGRIVKPLEDPHDVVAHSFKENPYQTMIIMAAVGINREEFAARKMDTQFVEVPLCIIRAYTKSNRVEMRPGFGSLVPYDKSALVTMHMMTNDISAGSNTSGAAAADEIIKRDRALGQGKHGGTQRLRRVYPHIMRPPTGSAAAVHGSAAAATATASRRGSLVPAYEPVNVPLAYAVEAHRFLAPDGCMYEFSVSNPDDDPPSLRAVGAFGADALPDEDTDAAVDALSAVLQEELTAMDRASHRVGSDFFSIIPHSLHPASFRLTVYLELVAAARFYGPSAVYVAYELVLPTGSGWKILPSSDAPAVGGGGRNALMLGDGGGGGLDGDEGEEEGWLGDDAGEAEVHNAVTDAADAAASGVLGLRKRGAAAVGGSGGDENGAAAVKGRRRWLRSTRIAGVTQVAQFATRPWTFGSCAASKPSGQRAAAPPASAGEASPFFSGPSAAAAQSPFSAGDRAAPFPGFARDSTGNYATGAVTHHTKARADGSGSVSLVSSFATEGYGPSGALSVDGPDASAGGGGGFTPVAVPPERMVPVAHLCFPVSIHLLCDAAGCAHLPAPPAPQLYFSVYSKDSYDRHRAEGYGYMELQPTAGAADTVVRTWKPEGTIEQQERDFFLGGSTRLSDVTYARIPSTWQEHLAARAGAGGDGEGEAQQQYVGAAAAVEEARSTLSRFGFRTITAGELAVRTNTIVQRRPAASSSAAQERSMAAAMAQRNPYQAQTVQEIIAKAKALRKKERLGATLSSETLGGLATPAPASGGGGGGGVAAGRGGTGSGQRTNFSPVEDAVTAVNASPEMVVRKL